MRRYLPGVGLMALAVVFRAILTQVGKTPADPSWQEGLYATGMHLVIAYFVVGAGLVAYARLSETSHLTFPVGIAIGGAGIASVYLARRFHPAVGSNLGSDPGVFWVAVVAILFFVAATARSSLQWYPLLAVAVIPPYIRVEGATGYANIIGIFYAVGFFAGILYGIPLVFAAVHSKMRPIDN